MEPGTFVAVSQEELREGQGRWHAEAFLEQLCAELARDARSAMFQMRLFPHRPVLGFDREPIRGLEGATWHRRPIVWGPHERLDIVLLTGRLVGVVAPRGDGGWEYHLEDAL